MKREAERSMSVTALGRLVEGTDILCADAATALQVPMHLLLLTPPGMYKGDAAKLMAGATMVSTVSHKLGDPSKHAALAEFMVARIDFLIAVWDNNPTPHP